MLFRLWDREPPGEGVFREGGHVVVASHALAKEVLSDAERFTAANALEAVTSLPPAVLRELTRHRFRLPPTMANNDTGTHPRMRELFAEVFDPRGVGGMEAPVRAWTAELVAKADAALRRGETVDLDADLCAEIPLRALERLLDLPAGSTNEVKLFARGALEMFWARPGEERQLELAKIVGPFHRRLRDHVRRAEGPVAAVRDEIGEDEATGALFFLLVAGQETTAQFLTLLLDHLIARPQLAGEDPAGVVEEGLRLFPSIVSWRRKVKRDTDIGGLPVEAGESVLVWLAAAGRDEGVARCPAEFRPGQKGSRRHLAFGAGAHRCLGSQLTRMEARVVLEETRDLLAEWTLVSRPRSDDNMSFRMPRGLVVRRAGTRP
ncbi:cytochrome P450 [Salininema proteolyticum]|uniref:Cytochrome P450 n=1 Tax=Salininema proteolyticum TaxID=1607685 RepID=A0ABV8U3F8_9ACTN